MNRSRPKRKAAGWVMALARIVALKPDLLDEIIKHTRAVYADRIGDEPPWPRIVARAGRS